MPRLDVEVGGCYLVRSSDPETVEVAACGGAVTELLRYALEEGLSDVAVCVERGADVLDGRPVVVDDPSEVPSGSYHCAPVQLARIVAELHREDPTLRVTVTCRPCDARALERLAERDLVDLNRVYRIGLNCGGTFEPWVVLEILEEHGVDPSNVEREEIVKGRLILETEDGTEVSVPIDVLEGSGSGRRENCRRCDENVPKSVDLACGNWGVPQDLRGEWTFVEVKTEVGAGLLAGAREDGRVEIREAPDESMRTREKIDGIMRKMAEYWRSETLDKGSLTEALEALDRCVKCRSCREVCPVCSACEEGCWEFSGRGRIPPNQFWHAHVAQCVALYCVECGACETACPAEIPLTRVYHTLRRELPDIVERMTGRRESDSEDVHDSMA
ncbi:Coenzyme F420 hydrogenase/dehydrogenase, beta subunit C-terminal domain [Methanopyrus sp. SNP6]|uniref:Coenzyme F420 hydrogenase/dehydrogenase, beta subunit C-terminal domain n=1 Tax=Methanopyrus sp. SNP6 TaxID=1937005 RepID=UPI0011E59251|nr:Coenzyme F420 hydrogenase/dehydrogenase, beta subunit C-terminal domain [Methanopyrus sp. SNP6]